MIKKTILFLFILLAAVVLFSDVKAEARWGPKFKHADKNKDGVVDKKERVMEKKWEHKQKSKVNTWWEKRADKNADGIISPKERRLSWQHSRSHVNTALEQKYDADGNGWLEPEEAKELLRDRHTLIKTNGKAKVDSALEEEYDTDGDGIIDAAEAEALKEDIE